jgi:hypothetical protein
VEAGHVVRTPKAYPVYDDDYKANVDVLRAWLEEHATNVHPIGRCGMHRYNSQDHSMYTAPTHDSWAVNVEEEYHEEATSSDPSSSSGTGRDAPVLPSQRSKYLPLAQETKTP